MIRMPVAANWLLRAQAQLHEAVENAEKAQDRKLIATLKSRLKAINSLWREHPCWFELEPASCPTQITPYTSATRNVLLEILESTEVWIPTEAFLEYHITFRNGSFRKLSRVGVRKALQQLLLEGLVQRRFALNGFVIEWQLEYKTSKSKFLS